jgi:hypothetical protein
MDRQDYLQKDLKFLLSQGYFLIGPNLVKYIKEGDIYVTDDITAEAKKVRQTLDLAVTNDKIEDKDLS